MCSVRFCGGRGFVEGWCGGRLPDDCRTKTRRYPGWSPGREGRGGRYHEQSEAHVGESVLVLSFCYNLAHEGGSNAVPMYPGYLSVAEWLGSVIEAVHARGSQLSFF